jgi:nanoRNase/pAp phosphatase (c-di-AMP/oligoRNAs hydrolase)
MIKQGFDNETMMITAYENPDLDGVACAYAYSEFLNNNDKKYITALFGKPHK